MRYAYHHSCTQIFLSPHPRIQTSEQPQWMLISVLQTNYSIFFFVFNKFSLGQPKAISGKQDQRETSPCFLRPVLEGGIRLPITRYLKYLAPFHNSRSPPLVSHLTKNKNPVNSSSFSFIHGETYLFAPACSRLIQAPSSCLSRLSCAKIASPFLLEAPLQDSSALLQTGGPTSSLFDRWVSVDFE